MNERRRNDVIANVISQSNCFSIVMTYHDSDKVKQKEVMLVEKQTQQQNHTSILSYYNCKTLFDFVLIPTMSLHLLLVISLHY